MNIRSYIDFQQLLAQYSTTHEQHRAWALQHNFKAQSDTALLLAWIAAHKSQLSVPTRSARFCKYLYGITLLLGMFALLLGFIAGIGLLSYSGKEPVNLIYFLVVAVVFPLFTMFLSLLSMLHANRAQSLLIHISPAFWMEGVLGLFSDRRQEASGRFQMNPLLLNWLVIKRAQLLGLLFSLGLLAALLGIVATKDIAFAWSTTLQVAPATLHGMLEGLALPWREWLPSAVPSMTLIEQSQYFRLGGRLGNEMLSHASLLGEWWKFLAMATLCYAVLLRLVLWRIAEYAFGKALVKSLRTLEGAERLLYEMKTPVVSSIAVSPEMPFEGKGHSYSRLMPHLQSHYHTVLGWAMDKAEIHLLNDAMHIEAIRLVPVGGMNTLEADQKILEAVEGEVLLYVKSWEPPTMDILDFLQALTRKASRVVVVPIGMASQGRRPKPNAVEIWSRKLVGHNDPKVWLWQNKA